MTAKIISLGNVTCLDLPPDRILNAAVGQMESVVILGYDKEDQEYFASSLSDGGAVLWLLERFKKQLLEAD